MNMLLFLRHRCYVATFLNSQEMSPVEIDVIRDITRIENELNSLSKEKNIKRKPMTYQLI